MLKKCLLGLFVGFVGLIGFGYCDNVSLISPLIQGSSVGAGKTFSINSGQCFFLNNYYCSNNGEIYNNNNDLYLSFSYSTRNNIFCLDFDGYYKNTYSSSCAINVFSGLTLTENISCPECQECPGFNTGEVYSGWIKETDIDALWSKCLDMGFTEGNSSGSRSELMINNIVHEGKPLINVSIPDNIYWDYTTDDNQFDLYVGSGYDQDYIDSVLAINSYRPDNEDFTNIFVSGLTLIFPYIFVALLIVFIWKLLKRIFK